MNLIRRLFGRQPAAPSAFAGLRLAEAAEAELGAILAFWQQNARDPEGGFWTQWRDGPKREGARGALLTSRILWAFSTAHRRFPEAGHLEMAHAAYADLQRFHDAEHGGLLWSIGEGAEPPHKRVYGQAFGIYGLSEYFRASGNAEALEQAIALYRLIETHARDHEQGGYLDMFAPDWSEVRANGRAGPKSLNTMLHLMEAYANLLRAWPDPGLRADLAALVELLLDHVLDPASAHLRLFLTLDLQPASDRYSPGHDIEFSWLVLDTAQAIGDPALEARARTAGLAIATATLPLIEADGGISYELGPEGPIDWHRAWWVMAEAAVGFLNAFELSGEPRFRTAAEGCWAFVDRHVIDHERGEWHSRVLPGGGPDAKSLKLGFWKCPYHNVRTTMEISDRVRRLGNKITS